MLVIHCRVLNNHHFEYSKILFICIRVLDPENQQFFTCDPAKPQAQVPPFGDSPADGGSKMPELFANDLPSFGDFPKGATSEVFTNIEHPFGDVPLSQNRTTDLIHHNPFGDFAEEVTGMEFGDEDFMLDAGICFMMLQRSNSICQFGSVGGCYLMFLK